MLLSALTARAGINDVIDLTNRVFTFTSLDGTNYTNVTLMKADLDGIFWKREPAIGRVSFTNIAPATLEALDIPTNRIEIAAKRASDRALADERFRANEATQGAAAASLARQHWETNELSRKQAAVSDQQKAGTPAKHAKSAGRQRVTHGGL